MKEESIRSTSPIPPYLDLSAPLAFFQNLAFEKRVVFRRTYIYIYPKVRLELAAYPIELLRLT